MHKAASAVARSGIRLHTARLQQCHNKIKTITCKHTSPRSDGCREACAVHDADDADDADDDVDDGETDGEGDGDD